MEIKKKESASFVGIWQAIFRNKKTGKIERVKEYQNLLPTIGRRAVVMQFAGTNTEELEVKYIAVGTGSTAPSNADTKLEFEVTRKAVGSGTVNGVEASIAAFFSTADIPDKTYLELGAFADGGITASSAAADSGILVSHVAVVETVSATQTMTLTFRISANDGGA